MSIKIMRLSIFDQYPELIHGVSTTDFGNMSFRYGTQVEVASNRKKFFVDLGIPSANVAVTQLVHEADVLAVTEKDRGKGVETSRELLTGDVLITDKSDTFLFFVVADCMALFFYDPVKKVCALAHAGWKGVDMKVPQVAVQAMVNQYNCNPQLIRVGISPSIKAPSAKFKELDQAKKPAWQPYITKVGEYY